MTDRAFDHLHHRIGGLLPVQTPAHQVAAVIIDDPDQVDLRIPVKKATDSGSIRPPVPV